MTDMCYASGINPSAIPGQDLDPDAVEAGASTLRTKAGAVRDNGAGVVAEWRGLAAHYEAPEAAQLLAVMDEVETKSRDFGDALESVATALSDFAAEIRPIKSALDAVRADAYAFRDRIAGNAEWEYDQDLVDENTALVNRVNTQQVALWDAERRCANAIRALYCAAPWRAATSENDPLGYGVSELSSDVAMPWGSAVDRKDHCPKAAAVEVKRFVWDGVLVEGVWGTVEGLGLLVGIDGNGFSTETLGSTWNAIGSLVGLGDIPPGEAWAGMGKGIIMWDAWAEGDYGRALGGTAFNVVTAIIPGGAAVSSIKGGSTAGRAGRGASWLTRANNVLDFVDPVALGIRGGRAIAPTISNLFNGLTDGLRNLEVPDFPTRFDTGDVPGGGRGTDYDAPSTDTAPVRDPDAAPVREQPAEAPAPEPVPVNAGGVSDNLTDGAQPGGSGQPESSQPGRSDQPGGAATSPEGYTGSPSHSPAPHAGGTDAPTSGSSGPDGGSGARNTIVDSGTPRQGGSASSGAGSGTLVDELTPSDVADDVTRGADDGATADVNGGDAPPPGGTARYDTDAIEPQRSMSEVLASPAFREVLERHGLSRARLGELIATPLDELTSGQVRALVEIRSQMPPIMPGDIMEKVVRPELIHRELDTKIFEALADENLIRHLDGQKGLYGADAFTGFVARSADMLDPSVQRIFHQLGLGYPGSPFTPDTSMFSIRLHAGDIGGGLSSYTVPDVLGMLDEAMDLPARNGSGSLFDEIRGLPDSTQRTQAWTEFADSRVRGAEAALQDAVRTGASPETLADLEAAVALREAEVETLKDALAKNNPFRGNGFAGHAHAYGPEYTLQGLKRVPEGAEMWQTLPDGTRRFIGVYDGNKWQLADLPTDR